MNIFLILGPALNGAATFFWKPDTQGAVAGALSGVATGLWLIGILALCRRLPHRYERTLVPLAVGGTVGGVAFSVQAVHEEMFGISHATAVEMLNGYPPAANALFWICGPLFPLTVAVLGVVLWRARAVPVPVSVLLVIAALAFPLSRMSREITVAHVADLLMLLPFGWLAVRGTVGAGRLPEETPSGSR
jgi:hypothetical protein